MRFRVLGPLQVRAGNGWTAIRAGQQRVVLAVLLAEAGRVVSADRLIDEIWGPHPPRSAPVTVQGYVARLRRLLGEGRAGTLLTRDRGYELAASDEDVDANRFQGLVAAGRRGLADGDAQGALARLTEGLELWQGPALSDVPASPTVTGYASRLDESKLAAREVRLDALLELGRHTEVAAEAGTLVEERPYRERPWAQLMMALYRGGRRAEALTAYRSAYQLLTSELGVEPGRELRELHRTILAGAPALAARPRPAVAGLVTPAQLPADVAGFTGRRLELKQLDALLPEASGGAGVPGGQRVALVIATIAGTAGVGKTALAVRWAHQVRDRFPDGQLYVNLRGYEARAPLRPIEALAAFLVALGVPSERVPVEVEDASALYRSLLAGKRMLVLLDNAHRAEQVRPLLPGSGGCLVVLTSRGRLASLVAREGAVRLDLDVLSPEEAQTLLGQVLGTERVDAEPEPARRLARLCGHLPLALRIAAANLAARPRTRIAGYLQLLGGGDRLAVLQVDGDQQVGVRATFNHSYSTLTDELRRLFRRLGLAPGPDITVPAAAALAGLPAPVAERQLDQLAASYLVDVQPQGRYELHDLIRLYAAERAAVEESEPDRGAALDRLYGYYLGRVDAAASRVYPEVIRLPGDQPDATGFPDAAAGLAWLGAERANLVAAVRTAAVDGHRRHAWRLADALCGYLRLGGHAVDWAVVAKAGLAAAVADRDQRAQAAAHLGLAMLHSFHERHQVCIEHYTTACRLSRASGWREGESAALGRLATLRQALGQLPEAVAHWEAALVIDREIGWRAGEASKLAHLSRVWVDLGRLDLALDYNTEALRLYRENRYQNGEARTLSTLGHIQLQLGRLAEAEVTLQEALALHRATGDRVTEGYSLCALALVHREAGRHQQALAFAEAALACARQTEDRWVEVPARVVQAAAHSRLGDHRRAVADHRRALRLVQGAGLPGFEMLALVEFADAVRRAGHPAMAAGPATTALTIARRVGYRIAEGQALTVLATVHLDLGRVEQAADLAEQAVTIHTGTGHRPGLDRAGRVATEARHRLEGRASPARPRVGAS
jgi:DNA-binding SARP family transcriptional activator/tetratricopeptide (TPR) repeat protein